MNSKFLAPFTEWLVPGLFPALQHQGLRFQPDAAAKGDGPAHAGQVCRGETKGPEGRQGIDQHVGGKSNLRRGDRQDTRLSGAFGIEPTDHMMEIVGCCDPLGQSESLGCGVTRAEEIRVVVELADHSRVGPAQAPVGKRFQSSEIRLEGGIALFDHFSTIRQGLEALKAEIHCLAVDEVVDQISDALEAAFSGSHLANNGQIPNGSKQFSGSGHHWFDPEGWRSTLLYSEASPH